jgi:O-methyltransferase involved in polyketide biosynthesis
MVESNVEDTAFLTVVARDKYKEISKDIFAKYWYVDNPKAINVYNKYKEVSGEFDVKCISLRNQFFLNELNKYFTENSDCMLINIGAGFSSYAYLINNVKVIEIDSPNIIKYKQKIIKKYNLEKRIEFYSIDLNIKEELIKLKEYLKFKISKKSFILMEGLIYYLNPEIISELISICREVQIKGSVLGIVYLPEKDKKSPLFNKFKDSFNNIKLVFQKATYYSSLEGYNLIKDFSYKDLFSDYRLDWYSRKYFCENMVILERK